jgi:hypothetical protein
VIHGYCSGAGTEGWLIGSGLAEFAFQRELETGVDRGFAIQARSIASSLADFY